MHILKNRIVISLIVIFVAIYLWEFWIKPVTGPEYTAAVAEYRGGHYERSLRLLREAYAIDPNDTAILTLLGWNELKLGHLDQAEANFKRSDRLDPGVKDNLLGYAYTEIALKKYEDASRLLALLGPSASGSADVHLAWGALYRAAGQNRLAAHEFARALALRKGDPLALRNLRQLYNAPENATAFNLEFKPLVRAGRLTMTARAQGQHFDRLLGGRWRPVYLTGVDLIPALPGEFPSEATTNADLYSEWLQQISNLGVNTVRVMTILPPAFYRTLYEFNRAGGHPPLWLLQGISFMEPPHEDMFAGEYYKECRQEIAEAVDTIHGQGDIPANPLHAGGLYPDDISPWVAGFLIGNEWLSHVVILNNRLHPDIKSYDGTYFSVPSGSPTEVFLAQMLDYADEYEEEKYNWQHPVAFLNWPTLDPITHPTESTMVEEIAIRRKLGERLRRPPGPYDDEDAVTVDPMHLQPTEKLKAGYFADYSVSPFYPDFINLDPGYRAVVDSQGSDSFLGYLRDLKAHHRGVPLVISDYGLSTSLGIGHFNPAGFDDGGLTERQQGNLLARMTRNVHESGAAGGTVFEWLDEWFRRAWVVRNYEVPEDRKPLWTDFMDPAEYYGLMATDPRGRTFHRLEGTEAEWANHVALYKGSPSDLFHPVGDRWDAARDLKALYADADEGFLYLHLVVGNLDVNHTGHVDWSKVNYLIGIGTDPGQAGLTYLPFIAPVRFSLGMTYAVQLAGPQASHILVASSYDPYQISSIPGIPSGTVLAEKPGWMPHLTGDGTFEAEIIEPNRRRYSRAGKYFPPERYERGILRYGTLDPGSPDYDPLAEWHVNVANHSIDLRIPWNLLNVCDPSSLQIFAGMESDGTVETVKTPGFILAVFSYRPRESSELRSIMEQGHPVADSLPALSGPATMPVGELRKYRWSGWASPQYTPRLKSSYGILRRAFLALPSEPPSSGRSLQTLRGGRK